VGERSCPAWGCGRGGWCRRFRRRRRAQLVIGDGRFRSAGTVVRPSSVSVAKLSHAVPQRVWQHAQCTAIPRRRWTFFAMFRERLRAPGKPFGASVVHRPKRTVLRCETSRHVPRFEVPGVSCQAGSVGIGPWRQRRGGVPDGPHAAGHFRAVDQKRWLFASADEPEPKAGNR
jgi:hypothetical protein